MMHGIGGVRDSNDFAPGENHGNAGARHIDPVKGGRRPSKLGGMSLD